MPRACSARAAVVKWALAVRAPASSKRVMRRPVTWRASQRRAAVVKWALAVRAPASSKRVMRRPVTWRASQRSDGTARRAVWGPTDATRARAAHLGRRPVPSRAERGR